MLHHHVLCIGRRAQDPLLAAADDYLQRLSRYAKVTRHTLKEGTLEQEAHRLLDKAPTQACLVAMDERGKEFTTMDLAKHLQQWQQRARSDIAWILGGADGLHPRIKSAAHEVWSLSRLTLPHRLAQALLLEQLYRAHTVLRNEKYHRV